MKIDIDSIFYIILSIIILVVSGLGSKRRRQSQQMKKTYPAPAQGGTQEPEAREIPRPPNPVVDPFERLEQILSGQSQYENLEGESLEVLEDEEQRIIDEEEAYLAPQVPQQERVRTGFPVKTEDEQRDKSLDCLFRDMDDITRAVIYSEILPRKYI
jgi:FtsZ-interacting cell division protein ZipA